MAWRLLMARFVGKVVLGAAGCCGAAAGGIIAFDRYENHYWHAKDPWRARREDDGLHIHGDNFHDDAKQVHYGWCRDARGDPLLRPTGADAQHHQGGKRVAGKRERLVVLGTGWGARYLLQGIDKDKYEVRVISPRNFFLFTPLLPSTSTGTLSSASICSPIRELISYKSAPIWRRVYYMFRGYLPSETRFYPAEAEDVDLEQKIVHCSGAGGRFGMHYDKLVVAIGATTNTFGTAGVEENCLFMKEIGDGIQGRRKIFDAFERVTLPMKSEVGASSAELDAERRRMLHFVVVGGGPTGVECAAELQDLISEDLISDDTDGHALYKNALRTRPQVTLIQSADMLLNAYHPDVSKLAKETMETAGVEVLLNHRVKAVKPQAVVVTDKLTKVVKEIPFGVAIWATGVGARPLTQKLIETIGGAAQNNKRALTTNGALQVLGGEATAAAAAAAGVNDNATNANSGSGSRGGGGGGGGGSTCGVGVVDGLYAIGDCATITKNSMLSDISALWDAADVDRSGALTQGELETLFKQVALKYPQAGAFISKSRLLLARFDTDGDGLLSKAEFETLCTHIDTCHRSLPPTAQVAKQQGLYLAASLNAATAAAANGTQATPKPFDFASLGQMAYVGKNVSVAGFETPVGEITMGDAHLTNLIWRLCYWTMLADSRSMAAVPLGWAYAAVFGRDSSCRWGEDR